MYIFPITNPVYAKECQILLTNWQKTNAQRYVQTLLANINGYYRILRRRTGPQFISLQFDV